MQAARPQPPVEPAELIAREVGVLSDPQRDLPRIAKDEALVARIQRAAQALPTEHRLVRGDARALEWLPPESVHLVLTSPPYWTLKKYRASSGQMGDIADYEQFLADLDRVWAHCYRALVPGGRLICVVGDVCLSRRQNGGRHTVVPLHAAIQERCRSIGFDNLAPIIWHKIANAAYEVERGSGGFLGKPFEPNAVIKNDIEFILMQRKPGGYRQPDVATRVLSVLSAAQHGAWPSARPWLGYLMLLEDCPSSIAPVRAREPHYRVFEEFRSASYARRYELLLTKMVRERLYDAACLLLAPAVPADAGEYREPSSKLTFENFIASLLAKAIAAGRVGGQC